MKKIKNVEEKLILPFVKELCKKTIEVSQNNTCLMFLGEPKKPINLDKVNIEDL